MELDSSNISNLLKVAREGDLVAFEQVMHVFERRVYGFVFRHVSNREDAEDITQEIFIKLYKNFSNYNLEQKFETWLFTIATHTIYDFLRKRRGKQELLIIDDAEHGFETKEPRDAYIEVAREIDVAEGLEKIKPTYRTVLMLFYRDQLTCEEIAEVLGKPVGTIKTHLSRAREALKQVL